MEGLKEGSKMVFQRRFRDEEAWEECTEAEVFKRILQCYGASTRNVMKSLRYGAVIPTILSDYRYINSTTDTKLNNDIESRR